MIRDILERKEFDYLRDVAQFSSKSKGRTIYEQEDSVRLCFQRDRDRIIHTKSFRRLKHKTQVYIAPIGDHYRTRLTHTLEVAQIGRTIARALFLNEDLVEAMALGHDIGHTPFGHAGEKVLNEISNQVLNVDFKHYEQSLRVLDFLESHNGNRGLNLTFEVRDGIKNHSGQNEASTLEGKILKLADRIAYINHDIDDAIRAGFLKNEDIPKDITEILGSTGSKRIDTLVRDVINFSTDKNYVKMSPMIYEVMNNLREFMFERVYLDERSKEQGLRINKLISSIFYYYLENPKSMGNHLDIYDENEKMERIVIDYIAGMTDQFAIETFKNLFLPTSIRRV